MSKTKKKDSKEISPKKQLNQKIADQLSVALNGSLKDILGEKKLKSRVKKAARVLTNGIKVKVAAKPKAEKKKDKKQTEVAPASTNS